MSFGIFMHRADSIYDDSPAERYQFPRQYLSRVQACVGDWIVYLEPTKVPDTRGYFAVAKVQEVVEDTGADGMYIAVIEPGTYLDFANPVPFSGPEGVTEQGLVNEEGGLTARRQWAVRPLSPGDFARITELGLAEGEVMLPREDARAFEMDDEQAPFVFEQERDRAVALTSRAVRDPVFRCVVLRAYDERCALTGLKLINGGGRAEVQAAHIRPVKSNGPDIVTNGLALSGTVHWMFDRGLLGLGDDLKILISRQVNDQEGIRAILNKDGRARPPVRQMNRPHPHFLSWHRQHVFKQ